jgi:hypothetical protein
MKEKLFIPLNATKSTGTNTTSPTERPNKSIELGKWIKRFLGISPQGDSNLVFNQQGNWVRVIPEINYFSAENTIAFTNNGGDDWDITFKITPDSMQLPSGYSIVSYDYLVNFSVLLVENTLDSGTTDIDYTFNTSGNGAGVYYLEQQFGITNGINNTQIQITRMIKVDGSGTILYDIQNKGAEVLYTNGLVIELVANIEQTGVNYPINWLALDNNFNLIPLPQTGEHVVLTLPINTVAIYQKVELGTEFTIDTIGNLATSTGTIIQQ